MMSSGEKDKAYWASMYYDRVWDEYIPGMLEWCKENNIPTNMKNNQSTKNSVL
jgi:hypothetical protein